MRSSGTIAAASRIGADFLKVTIPENEMQNPSARNSRAASAFPVKR